MLGRLATSRWWRGVEYALIWLSVFLVPWQLRHTLWFAQLNGDYFEYGSWQVYASDVVILCLLIVGAGVVGRVGFRSLPRKVGVPLLAVLVWMTITAWWAADRGTAVVVAMHWWLFYGWCIYLVNRISKIEQLLWPLVIGAAVQGGWGLAQYIFNQSLGLSWLGESVLDPVQPGISVIELSGVRHLRAYGLLPHPNILAGVLVAGVVGVLGLAQQQLRRWQWVVLGISGVALVSGVVLAFSRIAWVIFVLVIMGAMVGGVIRRQGKLIYIAGLMLGIAAVVAISQWQYIQVRFQGAERLEQQSIDERRLGLAQWQQVISQAPDKGVGLGNYATALARVVPEQPAWWYAPVHNIYLVIAGEVGAIGAAMWLWFLVGLGQWWWRNRQRGVVFGLGTPLMIWLGCGLTDHWPISLQQGQLLFFLALALIILSCRSMIQNEWEGWSYGRARTERT